MCVYSIHGSTKPECYGSIRSAAAFKCLITRANTPTRGPYIDSVRVVIDAAADAIAVPYLSHIRKVE